MFVRKSYQHKLKEWSAEQLIRAFQHTGDQQYFNALFSRYLHLVYYTTRNFLEDREECRDVVMQVFAKIFQQLQQQQEVHSFGNWLYTLTRNECISKRRSSDKQTLRFEASLQQWQEEPAENPDTGAQMVSATDRETEDLVQAAMLQLDEGQRICLELFFFEKKSYREIADITSFTENQVKSFLQNGKRRLRQLLAPAMAREGKTST